jgi:hypothetical protein
MINKPYDFDTAKATGDFTPLEPGGYICTIVSVEETMSKTGKQMIKINLDIAEGNEKGRFSESFRNDMRTPKKWPISGTVWLLISNQEGKTHGRFKKFTNSVVESNNNFEIVWGASFCKCFKGKLVGVLFGKEEYMNQDGELKWNCKPKYFESTLKIRSGEFKIPADKPYEQSVKNNQQNESIQPPDGFAAIDDEDIPF